MGQEAEVNQEIQKILAELRIEKNIDDYGKKARVLLDLAKASESFAVVDVKTVDAALKLEAARIENDMKRRDERLKLLLGLAGIAISAVVGLAETLLILNFEKLDVVTSKAFARIKHP